MCDSISIVGMTHNDRAIRGLTAKKGNTMKNYPETLSAKEAYDMTESVGIQKLSTAAGQILAPVAYVLREDTNADGEINEIVSVKDEDGTVYATNSKTFVREFKKVLDCVKDDFSQVHHIEVVQGRSKNNRTYITMRWVD